MCLRPCTSISSRSSTSTFRVFSSNLRKNEVSPLLRATTKENLWNLPEVLEPLIQIISMELPTASAVCHRADTVWCELAAFSQCLSMARPIILLQGNVQSNPVGVRALMSSDDFLEKVRWERKNAFVDTYLRERNFRECQWMSWRMRTIAKKWGLSLIMKQSPVLEAAWHTT